MMFYSHTIDENIIYIDYYKVIKILIKNIIY